MFALTAVLVAATQSPALPHARDSLSAARGIDSIVAPAFAPRGAGGVVLVAHRDRVLFRRAYGFADHALAVPTRPEHVFLVGSITKEFTGAAILRLVAEGRVALDEDVRAYVPIFNTHGRRITVEQVLAHTAGIPNVVDLPGFDSLARHRHSVQGLLDLTRNIPLHFAPGSAFRYSDTGYFLLGAIIERVTGRTYADYVEQEIAAPLGLMRTRYADDRLLAGMTRGYVVENGVVTNAPFIDMSVPYSAGGLASSADDLLTWHRALRGGRVVPPTLLEMAWTGRTLPNGSYSGYGFGFKTCRVGGRRSVSHGGFVNGFGAQALMLIDDGIDVIVLVNNQSDVPDAGRLARRIARYLVTGAAIPPRHSMSAEERRRLVGHYRIASGDVREVFDSAGAMFSRRNQRPPVLLVALTSSTLTLEDSEGDYVFQFAFGGDGAATRVETTLGCEPVDIAIRLVQ